MSKTLVPAAVFSEDGALIFGQCLNNDNSPLMLPADTTSLTINGVVYVLTPGVQTAFGEMVFSPAPY